MLSQQRQRILQLSARSANHWRRHQYQLPSGAAVEAGGVDVGRRGATATARVRHITSYQHSHDHDLQRLSSSSARYCFSTSPSFEDAFNNAMDDSPKRGPRTRTSTKGKHQRSSRSPPTRTTNSNNNNHNYKQVGGSIDPIICTLSKPEIHALIKNRLEFRRAKQFREADEILRQLNKCGIQMDDKNREWSADGSQVVGGGENYGTKGGKNNNSFGRNKFGHEYTQVGGGTVDSPMCSLMENEVHTMIRKRMGYRRSRDFAKADEMRDTLSKSGVHMDDTLKQWYVAGTRGLVLNESGHDYTQAGGEIDASVCTLSEEEIHELIKERMQYRSVQKYQPADMILKELEECGVHVEDQEKLWRADGQSFEQEESANRVQSPKMNDFKTLDAAIEVTHDNLATLTTRDISAFWAVVPQFLERRSIRVADSNLESTAKLGAILAHTLENIDSFTSRDLATTTLGLAKVMKHVSRDDEEIHQGRTNQILRDILIGDDDDDSKNKRIIFRHLARSSMAVLEDFDARCVANICYGYALADHIPKFKDGSTLLDHLGERSIEMLEDFSPQGLSRMLWAYSTLGVSNSPLFEGAAEVIVGIDFSESFKPRDLSNLVWAYATAGVTHTKLFVKVANNVLSLDNIGLLSGQDCANILWAFSTAGITHEELFKKIAERIQSLDMSSLWPRHLSNIGWAFATAGESYPKVFEKLAAAAVEKSDEFSAKQLVNLLWAFAANGHTDPDLFSTLSLTASSQIADYDTQDLTNIAWAFAVADVPASSLFDDDFFDMCVEREDEFTEESLCQLHQWILWQQENKSTMILPQSLQEKCYDAFVSQAPERFPLQDEVISELLSMGLKPEATLTESGYPLYALVVVDGKTIVVEGDELSAGLKPSGATALKRRQITNLEDIQIVSVPQWKWDKLGNNTDKRQQYLQSLLGLTS